MQYLPKSNSNFPRDRLQDSLQVYLITLFILKFYFPNSCLDMMDEFKIKISVIELTPYPEL